MAGVGGDRARILIADDDAAVRMLLRDILCESYECAEVGSAEEALDLLSSQRFDLILSDINMGGISGLEMIPRVLASSPDAVIIMVSGEGGIGSAIEAMRAGAFDYITKPFNYQQVEAAVRRGLEHRALREAKRRYERYLEELLRRRTEELNHAVAHDAVTGLPNKSLFNDRLAQAITRARNSGQALAVIFLDLDRLKVINETLGYAVGDSLLRGVAERLSKCAREGETVARFGGDEFSMLLCSVGGAEGAAVAAQRIRQALDAPFDIDGYELYVTASVGICLYPDDGQDAGTLLKSAGAALGRAKQSGGGCHQFYSADMNADALERLSLETKLRRALERGEFTVHYQPQVELAAGRIVGAEALVRWQHPELGLVPPSVFIPLAEATGLIAPIGLEVLRTACRQCSSWEAAGLGRLRVAVNLSPEQFRQPELPRSIEGALRDSGLGPSQLELEITESSVMHDREGAVAKLTELRGLGVSVAIDDFGTGYSSLSYLKHLPVDTIKIDRTFVREMATDRNDAAIVRAIVTLGQSLGLRVKAEGVETQEQLDLLRAAGCDEAQGYLYSRPLPPDAFVKHLLEERGRRAGEAINTLPG